MTLHLPLYIFVASVPLLALLRLLSRLLLRGLLLCRLLLLRSRGLLYRRRHRRGCACCHGNPAGSGYRRGIEKELIGNKGQCQNADSQIDRKFLKKIGRSTGAKHGTELAGDSAAKRSSRQTAALAGLQQHNENKQYCGKRQNNTQKYVHSCRKIPVIRL